MLFSKVSSISLIIKVDILVQERLVFAIIRYILMATSVSSVETILLTRKIIAKIILFKSIIYFDQFPSTSRFELTFDLPLLDIYCVTLVNIKQSPKDIFFL